VFRTVYQKELEKQEAQVVAQAKAKHKKKQAGAEDDSYQDQQRHYRANTATLAGSDVWIATVQISLITKTPIVSTLFWFQKQQKLQNARVAAADKSGTTYLGPTPLSLFVTEKAAAVDGQIDALLTDVSLSADSVWAPVFQSLPSTLRASATQLIVEIVSAVKSAWHHRIMCRVQAMPLLVLFLVVAPFNQKDPIRVFFV